MPCETLSIGLPTALAALQKRCSFFQNKLRVGCPSLAVEAHEHNLTFPHPFQALGLPGSGSVRLTCQAAEPVHAETCKAHSKGVCMLLYVSDDFVGAQMVAIHTSSKM